ncbi:hypothetical protein NEMIN01_2389, partial [Nematocida minor]|uniref:uncharacterized protein n=1 Tax=Nematocida minor TaxID=1912983 RepID=UPI002220FD7A
TKYIKKMLPIGTLRRIAEYKECDVCSKYIYNPVLIYTSLTIADNTVPIKYNLCSDHEIDISNPYNSIRKSLFIEERHLDRSEEAEESRELIDILQVDKLIEKYNRKLYNNLRE